MLPISIEKSLSTVQAKQKKSVGWIWDSKSQFVITILCFFQVFKVHECYFLILAYFSLLSVLLTFCVYLSYSATSRLPWLLVCLFFSMLEMF